jgi:hypothetical protein
MWKYLRNFWESFFSLPKNYENLLFCIRIPIASFRSMFQAAFIPFYVREPDFMMLSYLVNGKIWVSHHLFSYHLLRHPSSIPFQNRSLDSYLAWCSGEVGRVYRTCNLLNLFCHGYFSRISKQSPKFFTQAQVQVTVLGRPSGNQTSPTEWPMGHWKIELGPQITSGLISFCQG